MARSNEVVSHREAVRVHAIGSKRYWIVWAALLVLTVLTVSASRIHVPGPLHLGIAMLIATVKATLVVLFFMHMWDHGGASRLVLGTAIVFFFLLLGLTMLDNATRFSLTNPPNPANEKQMPPGPDILSPMVGPPGGGAAPAKH